MPFQFSNASASPFRPGMIYLGTDRGREIGLQTDRHAITVAGSGTGKGAAVIIPNLRRWPHNVLCIDPGGGNAKETWEARREMGQKVLVFDPFKVAPVPPELRATFNPLQGLDPKSDNYAEDVGAIADGLVMRHDPKHATWDNRGRDIIEGVIDFVVDTLPPEKRTLSEVRRLLILAPDKLARLVTAMGTDERNAQSRAAAAVLASDMEKPNGYLINAQENTKWLDSKPIAAVLQSSETRLSAVKWEKASVYLVLPPDKLDQHGRFLRLFVRAAINEMANGGEDGERCLFILDEFFSLGKIDQVQKAAGLLRKNGVQLWPFLQDLGQLLTLYGPNGAHTFFANADLHMFFGNTDAPTLDYISSRIGLLSMAEIGPAPIHIRNTPIAGSNIVPLFGGASKNPGVRVGAHVAGTFIASSFNLLGQLADAAAEQEAAKWREKAAMVGRARLSPEQVRALVAKHDADKVARSMIVFGKGNDVFNLNLLAYFQPKPKIQRSKVARTETTTGPQTFTAKAAHYFSDIYNDRGSITETGRKKLAAMLLLALLPMFVSITIGATFNIRGIGAALIITVSYALVFAWAWKSQTGARLIGYTPKAPPS